jgi:tRNA(Ile)-lysidine synthase
VPAAIIFSMDLDLLRRKLVDDCGLSLESTIVLGFSGGPDSLALLSLLRELGVPVIAAHFDHGLRPESAQDALAAGKRAAQLGARFDTQLGNVRAYAAEHGKSIEEAARELRYRYLFTLAERERADAVAVAHNADDQAETVLMHLLRGAGPAGLRGMQTRATPNPWSDTVPLVRPLLSTWRADIDAYVQAKELEPIIDPSNADPTFFRNKLRHKALPYLEGLAPNFRARLNQTADLISADWALIDALAAGAWRRCVAAHEASFVRLHRAALLAEPLALQRAVLRKAAGELHPNLRDLDYAAVERALHAVRSGQPAMQDWIAGLSIVVEHNTVWVATSVASLPVDWPQAPEHAINIELPANMDLGGWRLTASQIPVEQGAVAPADSFQAWLDLRASGDELTLRRRRDGDRFQPLGLEQGSQKLSDFFVNEKLPARARAAWPLVTRGDEIVWVPGYRLAHPYRLRTDSARALRLALVKI